MSAQLYDSPVTVTARGAGNGARCRIGQGPIAGAARRGHVCAGVAHIRIRVSVVNVIKQIVHIGPDFESKPLLEAERFSDSEVHVRETRADQGVASGVAKTAGQGVSKGGGVEPTLDSLIR